MNMEFLYFPEDKMEYIPAIISLVIFMAGAIITMYILYKKSKKEEQMADQKYGQLDFDTDEKGQPNNK